MAETEQKNLPPYVSYPTLRNFLETLSNTATPKHIDKSMMPTLSGATQSHLMSTLRALGLTKPDGESTPLLHSLVEAVGKDTWPAALGGCLANAYAPILGDLNISHATPKQLRDRFKDVGGAEGSMNERCIRFYLMAMKDAKIAISPHLLARKPKGSGPKRSPVVPQTPATDGTPQEDKKPKTPPGNGGDPVDYSKDKSLKEFPVYFKGKPNGMVLVPENITTDDCAMFELTLGVIKAYAAQQSSAS